MESNLSPAKSQYATVCGMCGVCRSVVNLECLVQVLPTLVFEAGSFTVPEIISLAEPRALESLLSLPP